MNALKSVARTLRVNIKSCGSSIAFGSAADSWITDEHGADSPVIRRMLN